MSTFSFLSIRVHGQSSTRIRITKKKSFTPLSLFLHSERDFKWNKGRRDRGTLNGSIGCFCFLRSPCTHEVYTLQTKLFTSRVMGCRSWRHCFGLSSHSIVADVLGRKTCWCVSRMTCSCFTNLRAPRSVLLTLPLRYYFRSHLL